MCGWVGSAGSLSAPDVLKGMVAALGVDATTPPPAALSAIHPEGAVGVVPPGSLYEDDRYAIAWLGPIGWAPQKLADAASELGVGASLLLAYDEHGPACFDLVRTEAAIAVLDRRRAEIVLSIDRVGVHSLAFAQTPDGTAFASHSSALGAHPRIDRTLDPQSVYDYIYFHMVPSPRSIFVGWQKLGPGEYVVLGPKQPRRGKYWTPSYVDNGRVSERDLIEECRRTSRQAVANCLTHANGRVGAFLSGGTDSSTVAGLLTELSGEPAKTYSIGFDVPGFDESHYARVAVDHFGTDHHDYLVTADDVFQAAPLIARAYGEPFGNASAVASLYCAKLAKGDGIDTLFAGDGGDEIFAGNERYAKQRLFQYYYLLPRVVRHKLFEPVASAMPDEGLGLVGKARSYVQQARVPLPDRLNTYNFLARFPGQEIFGPEFMASVSVEEPLELLRVSYNEAETSSILHRMLYLDIKFTLADNDLRKVGRTCEMAGIDVQYPFLDLGLIEFANRVPPKLKLKGQKLRYFFKRASEGFLPAEILTKSKHGFGVPCGLWMRDYAPLRELAYDSLTSLTKRGYLRPDFVERLRALHQGEHVGYYGVTVWVLTMLELWHQHHVDS